MTSASIKVETLNSFLAKSRGLMFVNTTKPVYFKTRFGLHTFFVRHPIDVLILNDNNRVVKLKINLKPWKIFLWNPKCNKVLELPSGSIKKMKLRIGMKIRIHF